MTPPRFVLCLAYLTLANIVRLSNQNFSASHQQERHFVSANVGESVTLQCFYEANDATRFYWYKQSLGQKPQLISTQYVFKENGTFHGEFKNNPRFSLDSKTGTNHLHITDLQISDAGNYYCARRVSLILEFAEGTTVSVKGSVLNIKALVHQSASDTIQPGASVTLDCTVHTGTCDGEHSVYWFKDSEESFPGLIYTHGGWNDQCERKPNKQSYNCTYNLPMNVSHAGTYYCAVASCGLILFGEGTTLKFREEIQSHFVVYILIGALAFFSTIIAFLIFLLFKMSKRKSFQSEPQANVSAPSAEHVHDANNLHYASINVNKPSRSKTQRNSKSECVYSSVKQ
ncbi:uncharacterized protein LOC115797592 [Archocentrus centrarchus]|uniref:uncharacterized protein LOC115797592 n=1 Tax=Archocentrus centrarchus TaxID=63155 RepID=UPI0011E9FCCE|nr:uncharacterized protein LOC115797592 [Archocentrus centrarchus]